MDAFGPTGFDEPAFGRRVVGKHAGDLDQRETLAEMLAGCLVRHYLTPSITGASLPKRRFAVNNFLGKHVYNPLSYGLNQDNRLNGVPETG